jgi:hypothetical protein
MKNCGNILMTSLLLASTATAGLTGSTYNFSTSKTGTVTISPLGAGGSFTAPAGPFFCVGPNSDNCASSGLFGSISISNTQVIFSFSGSTTAATGTFVLNLTGFVPPNITNVTFNSGSLAGGTFGLTSFTSNSMVFTGTVNDGSFNAINGRTIVFDVATLTPPTFTKAFSPSTVFQSQTSTLTFTITNPNAAPLTGLAFTDTLPTGITETGVLSNTCGGTVTPTPSSVVLSAGTVAASSNCTVVVTVQATAAGTLVNTTSTLTSIAPTGAPATATLTVFPTADSSFQVRYAANLNLGESYVDITNTGANGASLLGPGLGGASGNICVNVYAFDASEELVSCCSCLVTPDQTVNLGVVADLTSKTLTGVVPTSVTVKLLATLAGTGGSGTGTVCNNSAASATTSSIVPSGLSAWGTTLHPQGAGVVTAETRFLPSTLSAGELASITGRCASIIGNASGFGICTSCRSGALGGQKM